MEAHSPKPKLVRVRAEPQRRIHGLDAEGLAAIDEWLAGIAQFWTQRLASPPGGRAES